MPYKHSATHICQICHHEKAVSELVPAALVRPTVVNVILEEHPDWSSDGYICNADLNHYRANYVENVLAEERGELTDLETGVIRSLRQHEVLSSQVEGRFAAEMSLGDRLADWIATFGGSWKFLICFVGLLGIWIVINSFVLLSRPFDPYPFILLNLLLSCLAAVQAPVIMMSQRRQEIRDRFRAEHDYQVNLKAELEIRQLHSKMDLLLNHQWHRLLEIQQIQLDILQGLGQGNSGRST